MCDQICCKKCGECCMRDSESTEDDDSGTCIDNVLEQVKKYFGEKSIEYKNIEKFWDEWIAHFGEDLNEDITEEQFDMMKKQQAISSDVVLGELQKICDSLISKKNKVELKLVLGQAPNNYAKDRSIILKLGQGTLQGTTSSLYLAFRQRQPEHCGIGSMPPTVLVYPAASVQPTQVLPKASPPPAQVVMERTDAKYN
jgi:hypothetical protein